MTILPLLAYVLLKGLENTTIRALQRFGMVHTVDGLNPVSACNLFFFSLLVVGLSLVAVDRRSLRRQLPQLNRRQVCLLWLDMLAGSLLGPLGSYMAIEALSVIEKTLVFSLVLPAAAGMAWLWLREPLPRRFGLTSLLIAAGLLLVAVGGETTGGMNRLAGLAWGGVGVLGFAASAVTSRLLGREGLCIGLTAGLPSLVAALMFYVAGLILFSADHFVHLKLWWVAGVVGIYAITLVLGSEWSLRLAYRRFSVARVAIVGSLTIAVSVVSAAVLLAEPINGAVVLGTVLVIAAVGLAGGSAPAQASLESLGSVRAEGRT